LAKEVPFEVKDFVGRIDDCRPADDRCRSIPEGLWKEVGRLAGGWEKDHRRRRELLRGSVALSVPFGADIIGSVGVTLPEQAKRSDAATSVDEPLAQLASCFRLFAWACSFLLGRLSPAQ